MLFALGGITFEVTAPNIHEVEGERGGDYAPKDIVGAQRPREFVGPADDKIEFSGRLFPQRLGGLSALSALQRMAEAGNPQMLIRGDGVVHGWYVIEKVKDKHTYLDVAGVGRMIAFDIEMVKSPRRASTQSMMSTIMSLF